MRRQAEAMIDPDRRQGRGAGDRRARQAQVHRRNRDRATRERYRHAKRVSVNRQRRDAVNHAGVERRRARRWRGCRRRQSSRHSTSRPSSRPSASHRAARKDGERHRQRDILRAAAVVRDPVDRVHERVRTHEHVLQYQVPRTVGAGQFAKIRERAVAVVTTLGHPSRRGCAIRPTGDLHGGQLDAGQRRSRHERQQQPRNQ